MNMQPQRASVQPLLCWRKGVFHISTDRQLLDIDAIQRFLSLQDRAAAERLVHHGLCFGLYRKRHLLGFARMVTDYATFASVSELFVSAEYRGVGLGSWLTRCCLAGEFPLEMLPDDQIQANGHLFATGIFPAGINGRQVY